VDRWQDGRKNGAALTLLQARYACAASETLCDAAWWCKRSAVFA
jgi:hypothetical protein